MSTSAKRSGDSPPPASSEEQDFRCLEEYQHLRELGDAEACARLLEQHPHLASSFRCLDALVGFGSKSEGKQAEVQQEEDSDRAAKRSSSQEATPRPDPAIAPTLTRLPGGESPSASHGLLASPADSSADQPVEFGSYELMGEIGRGGMGVVYKARHRSLNRTVAIKMILSGHLASDDLVRRFQLEARAAAGVSHPNVVSVFDVGQVDRHHFFAMEYVEGESLAQRLERGPFQCEEAAQLVLRLAEAVEHLHEHGIIHRDLKPANVLLDNQQRPRVTDFGLAKVFDNDSQATRTGTIAGTPSYMSPEQALGLVSHIGPRSDVYSLGAILYALLTGRPPFEGEQAWETLLQVIEREPALPRSLNRQIPRELEYICLKCLEKDPTARYGSAAELARDLESFLRGEDVNAQRPNTWRRLRRWGRRQPALAARIGGILVMYLVELCNYAFGGVPTNIHLGITITMLAWLGASYCFQQMLLIPRHAMAARYGWATIDALGLTIIALLVHGVASPIVVAYPMLIVASGLWYRVRMVWYTLALCLVSYGYLVFDFYRIEEPEIPFDRTADRHWYFAIALAVCAAIVAAQVRRLRRLSRYYHQDSP